MQELVVKKHNVNLYKVTTFNGESIVDTALNLGSLFNVSEKTIRAWNTRDNHRHKLINTVELVGEKEVLIPTIRVKHKMYMIIDLDAKKFIFEGTISDVEEFVFSQLGVSPKTKISAYSSTTKLLQGRYQIVPSPKMKDEIKAKRTI